MSRLSLILITALAAVVLADSLQAAEPVRATSPVAHDALDEVNATRAKKGLRPFKRDAGLLEAAKGAATYRAQRLIEGHTSNDFAFVPEGSSAKAAGCAAWRPEWGWGACCTYERWDCAGAAWARGRDGRRYMHLFVR